MFSSGADRLLREIAECRLEVIEGCGHCPQLEEPDRLAELLDGVHRGDRDRPGI